MKIRYGVLLLTIVASSVTGTVTASAQSAELRREVGGALASLRTTAVGVGGRFTYDVNRWLGLEGEFSFFPHDELAHVSSPLFNLTYLRRGSEALAGARVGVRGRKLGIFAKARPGVSVLSDRGVRCPDDACALVIIARPVYHPEFALDLGGIVEYYPTSRIVARADIGSLLVRHHSLAPPCWANSCTTNDLSVRFGLGWRF